MMLQFKSCPYTFIQIIRDLYAVNEVNSHWYYESVLFDKHLFHVFNYMYCYYYALHIICIIIIILVHTYSMRTLELESPIVFSYTEVVMVIFI